MYANIKLMLSFEQMLVRFGLALVLGALLGAERELVRKEAGIRTQMLVSGGAALFAMIGIMLPYITAESFSPMLQPDMTMINTGLAVIANIVVGIGFLGAGLIIKTTDHPHGVTTAALVWATAAIGVLAGLGLFRFAIVCALIIALLLFLIRKLKVPQRLEGRGRRSR
jgi:putative Mg2+ transporter-C (MgtC) family protein